MTSLKLIRKFDEQYGNRRKGLKKKASMGFGVLEDHGYTNTNEARIRPEATGS
jgi:hypothetical protein